MTEEPVSDMIKVAIPLTKVCETSILWTDSQEVRFLQAEAQFEVKRITASHTKFTQFVASLSQDVAFRLLDLVCAPPAKPYEVLRRRLIQMHSLSDLQRYQALQSLPLLYEQRSLQ